MCLGLVGESGCGKSTVAKAVLGILPPAGRVAGGAIRYEGRDLVGMTPQELRRIRWRDIALVPQSAMNGLRPGLHDRAPTAPRRSPRIAPCRRHSAATASPNCSRWWDWRLGRVTRLSAPVQRRDAAARDDRHGDGARPAADRRRRTDHRARRASSRTRSCSASALIHERLGKAMLLITHDMAVVAENCDRIAVMYAGRIMEYGGEVSVPHARITPTRWACATHFPTWRSRARR